MYVLNLNDVPDISYGRYSLTPTSTTSDQIVLFVFSFCFNIYIYIYINNKGAHGSKAARLRRSAYWRHGLGRKLELRWESKLVGSELMQNHKERVI